MAEAIANVIANNDDLKVIGLLGRWGSGKSTVVRHVQKHLAADAGIKTHVFCYDAWLHQSDPPRRSFLEALIAFLVSEKLTTDYRWGHRMDVLNRQVEDSETTSTPVLTASGGLLLLSLALIPLGMQFIGHDWFEALTKSKATWFERCAFFVGLALIAAPALLAASISLFGKNEETSLLALFVNRQVQKYVNRTKRTPEPTTIEFQETFREIVTAVSTEKNRLIFVIDNLDRLHEQEAVAMWGTIRSFFLGREHVDKTLRSARLPTVLLPVDLGALERMYSTNNDVETGKQLAKSFVDKTFDLAFYVTPPVLSDWNRYLAVQLKHVFGEVLDEAWAYQVGRLYEAHSRGGHEITPRAINVTINDIATLWLQWRDEIPFVTIAYFVVFRDRVEADIFSAVNSPAVTIADLDPNWQRGLAALHYGASPNKAIQVLIEPRLRKALEDWEDDEFKELAALPGFPETLQRVLDGARPARPIFVAQGTFLLTELGPEDAPWVTSAWSSLRDLYLQGQPFESFDESDVSAVEAMLASCPAHLLADFVRQIAVRLSTNLEQVLTGNQEARKRYVEIVAALVTTAKEHGLPSFSILHFGGADTYLETLQYAAENADVAKAIRFGGQDQLLVEALSKQMTAAQGGSVDGKFRALMHKEPKVEWDSLIEASRKYLNDHPGTTVGTLTAANVLGRFWTGSAKAKKAVRELGDDGTLNTRISESNDPNRQLRMSRLIALAILDERPLDQPGGNAWDSVLKSIPALAESVRTSMDKFDDTGTAHHVVAVSKQSPDALPLCRAILTKRVEMRNIGPLYVDRTIKDLPDYLNCIAPERQNAFIAALAGYKGFWEDFEKLEFDGNMRRILRALATGGVGSADNQKQAQKVLKERLQNVPQRGWKNAVQDGIEPLPIARSLDGVTKGSINAGQNLFEALKELIPAIVSDPVPEWGGRWFDAARLLSPASRKAAHRYLRDRMFGAGITGSLSTLLGLANDQAFEDADFGSVGDSTLRHIVAPLLTSDAGLAWLSANATQVKDWIASAPPDARTFLKEQVQHRTGEADDTMRKRIKSIAAEWSL